MSIAKGLRLLAAVLGACALLLLGGCGPGVGGTGTGETGGGLETFGAVPAPICSSELASILSCSSTTGTAAPAPSASAVLLADTIDGRQVQVTLRGGMVELAAGCLRLQFRGDWGAVAGQTGRFFGTAEVNGTVTPASLQVQVNGAEVQLTLRDVASRVLLGPVVVRVVAALGPPPACS
jgi:hypothetical protein